MNLNINKISIFLMLLLLVSCNEDFLNTQPHEFTDAIFWKTANQAESALAGSYTPLQDEEALGGEEWCAMEVFSDNAYMQDPYGDYVAMTEFRATQNNEGDLSHNSYVSYYKTIKRSTDVLNYVPNISMEGGQKKRILGEANFLKSFSYFELARRYGGLPIFNSKNPAASLVRKTEAETWVEIEKSLKEATSQLTWEHKEGRPGLGAAWGMLAKVYAYEKKWTEAKNAAETVINSGKHTLSSKYEDIFTIEHENDSEILFGLGARLDEYPITPILMLPNDVWGGKHPEPMGEGWRLVSATNAFYSAYQKNDLRKSATVAKRGVDVITYNGTTDVLIAPNNKSEIVCVKYNAPYKIEYVGWAAGLNVPALRYADVLLIAAESIMNLNSGGPGTTAGTLAAATHLNKVRQRAGLAAILIPTFADLMYERRMELAFEGGDRHFDLVRWGLATLIYNSLTAEGSYKPARIYVDAKNRLLPFPQKQIDNSNGSIKQNIGYLGPQ